MTKIIKQSLKHIDSAYIKALNDNDNEVISLVYKQINHDDLQKQISTGARYVAKLTGFGYHELKSLIQNRAITLMLNELGVYNKRELKELLTLVHHSGTLLDEDYAGQAIKYSISTVKTWAYSDKLKQVNAEHAMEFLSDHSHVVENSRTVAVQDTKNEMAAPLLGTLINRKDQLEFLTSILTVGKEQTKVNFDLEEKNFNKKLNRAIETIDKNIKRGSEDYNYTKVLINEIIETAINEPLSEDEELSEVYYESVSGY